MGCTGSSPSDARAEERAKEEAALKKRREKALTQQHGDISRRHGYVTTFHQPDPELVVQGPRVPGAFKALCIGMNYAGTKFELASGVLNAHNQVRFLKRHGFLPSHGFRCLTDDGPMTDAESRPTHGNILSALNWLVTDAGAGHSMYLHISGHMVRVPEEGDCLVPCDYADSGVMPAELLLELAQRVPHGARLVIVVDTAYSAEPVRLPWSVVLSEATFRWFQRKTQDLARGQTLALTLTSDVPDEQVAAVGMLTSSFEEAIDLDPAPTYNHLLRRIRERLRAKLKGVLWKYPKLSASHKFNVDEKWFFGCCDKDRNLFSMHQTHSVRRGTRGAMPSHKEFFVGTYVEGWFYDGWYPARVRAVGDDGTFDVEWQDGTMTMGLERSALRRPRDENAPPPEDEYAAALREYPDPETGRRPDANDPPPEHLGAYEPYNPNISAPPSPAAPPSFLPSTRRPTGARDGSPGPGTPPRASAGGYSQADATRTGRFRNQAGGQGPPQRAMQR